MLSEFFQCNARDLAWSPDGNWLASSDLDRSVHFWDSNGVDRPVMLEGKLEDVQAVSWGPDGQVLAGDMADGFVQLWNVIPGKDLMPIRKAKILGSGAAWSPDGALLATGSAEGTLRLWDSSNYRLRGVTRLWPGGVDRVAWHPGGRFLLSCGRQGAVHLWDAGRALDQQLAARTKRSAASSEPSRLQLVATVLPTEDGVLLMRADGRFNFTGNAGHQPLLGSNRCIFTPAEVAEAFPERVLAAGEPLLPGVSLAIP